jgi:acetyl esterase/lipase
MTNRAIDSTRSRAQFRAGMGTAIKLTRSIAYAERLRHRLDICGPAGAVAAPVVVFFYGGAWRSGNKALYRYVAKALARRGYVAVVPDYRIYPEARYPGFLEDGAQVVRWVKDNVGRFGGSPNKIFLMGHSAGAHIAAMLSIDGRWLHQVGLVPGHDIVGLIGLAGPYDYMPLRDATLKVIFGGADRPETQPIFHVAAGAPPALLLTGGRDRLVKPGNSTRLAARLIEAGNAVTVKTYTRVGHYVIIAAVAPLLRFLAPVLRDVDAFIAKTLQPETLRPMTSQAPAGTPTQLADYLSDAAIETAGS